MSDPTVPPGPTPAIGPGPVMTTLGVLAGLASAAIGIGLLRRVESPFGAVGASLMLVCALVIFNSCAILLLARLTLPVPRRDLPAHGEVVLTRVEVLHLVGETNLLLLGGWFAALGIVGGLTQSVVWPVLAVVPAVYFLGFPVLFALGRLRPGGVRIDGNRVVDEHFGVRSELALTDVLDLSQRSEQVVLTPREAGRVRRTHLTPRPWRARDQGDRMVLHTRELPGGSAALADLLRERAPRA